MKIYNKLVRDKTPEIIKKSGLQPVTRVLDDDQYLEELVKKLQEELAEFQADVSLEELADIQEVVLALADTLANREELERVRAKKAKERGAFKDKYLLEQVND